MRTVLTSSSPPPPSATSISPARNKKLVANPGISHANLFLKSPAANELFFSSSSSDSMTVIQCLVARIPTSLLSFLSQSYFSFSLKKREKKEGKDLHCLLTARTRLFQWRDFGHCPNPEFGGAGPSRPICHRLSSTSLSHFLNFFFHENFLSSGLARGSLGSPAVFVNEYRSMRTLGTETGAAAHTHLA